MDTIFLNPETNDLAVDVDGNIALATDPYSQAQDAASAIKLFQGEQWFNTTIGVPYKSSILGKQPNIPLLKTLFSNAALSVLPSGTKVQVFITSIVGRNVSGQVQVTPAGSTVATAASF